MSTLPLNDRLTPDVGTTYVADAAQTDFAADFPIIRNGAGAIEGLYVRRVRAGVITLLSYQGADFSVVGEVDDGFTARLVVGCAAGDLIQVYSQLPAARDRAHQQAGNIRTDTLEGDADSFQAQFQELRRDLGRAVVRPLGPVSITPAAVAALEVDGDYLALTDLGACAGVLPDPAGVARGAKITVRDGGYNAGVNAFTATVTGGGQIWDHGQLTAFYALTISNTGVDFLARPDLDPPRWLALAFGS